MFIPIWGNDPIWRAYFSNGLGKNHQLVIIWWTPVDGGLTPWEAKLVPWGKVPNMLVKLAREPPHWVPHGPKKCWFLVVLFSSRKIPLVQGNLGEGEIFFSFGHDVFEGFLWNPRYLRTFFALKRRCLRVVWFDLLVTLQVKVFQKNKNKSIDIFPRSPNELSFPFLF